MKTILWGAFYNHMVHESSAKLIGVYTTKELAEQDLELYVEEQRQKFYRPYESLGEEPSDPFGKFQSWHVAAIEVYDTLQYKEQ